jgi:hypothetical protein
MVKQEVRYARRPGSTSTHVSKVQTEAREEEVADEGDGQESYAHLGDAGEVRGGVPRRDLPVPDRVGEGVPVREGEGGEKCRHRK